MRPLDDFLPQVLPYAPGCPKVTALQALRRSAIEWCKRTRCWREIVTVTVTEQGQAIAGPNYAAIHEIENAHMNGHRLTPLPYGSADPDDIANTTSVGPAVYITQVSPNTVTLIPFETGELRMSLFLRPRSGDEFGDNGASGVKQDDQNRVPDHIFELDAEYIAAGALKWLLMMPKKEWTDPSMAAVHAATFEEGATSKAGTNIRGQQRARRRTTPHWF